MPIHAEDLRRYLATSTGRPIHLKLNNNTHTLISARPDSPGPGIKVSLHRMFLDGDEKLMEAIASFVHKPTDEARASIRRFIAENHAAIRTAAEPGRRLRVSGHSRGKVYDLDARSKQINAEHFGGALQFRIIWGKESRVEGRQRHITLGTWNPTQRVVRIHPILDDAAVPEYFLDYVIYHELTHIAVPGVRRGDRMHVHTAEFYTIERKYPEYRRARAWEERHITALMRRWNSGKPQPRAVKKAAPKAPVKPPVEKKKPFMEELLQAVKQLEFL